jgi:ATP/maltotriose-dependent transcriptional regulator MalT
LADEPTAEQLAEQLSEFEVEQFVVAAASTLASLAFAKLDRGDLDQAKKAIDTLSALLPQVEGDLKGDLRSALANLQVAYAAAASA